MSIPFYTTIDTQIEHVQSIQKHLNTGHESAISAGDRDRANKLINMIYDLNAVIKTLNATRSAAAGISTLLGM